MKTTCLIICIMAVAISAGPLINQEPIPILHQEIEVNPDGSFRNNWESGNGIKVQEEGTVKVVDQKPVTVVNGDVSYTDDQGNRIYLTYVADENGFQPHGDHLPTAPPLPDSVVRALEYIATHPHAEEHRENTFS